MPQVFQQTLWISGTGAEGEGQEEIVSSRPEVRGRPGRARPFSFWASSRGKNAQPSARSQPHKTEERAWVKKGTRLLILRKVFCQTMSDHRTPINQLIFHLEHHARPPHA